jgi:hypothetical protein
MLAERTASQASRGREKGSKLGTAHDEIAQLKLASAG